MKVTSNDSLLLDELYNDLRLEHIEVNKQTTITKGSMAVDGITIGLIIASGALALKNIDTILNLLTFLGKQKNYYIHIKLKDGREMKLLLLRLCILLHRSNKKNGIELVLEIGVKFTLNLVYFLVKLCQNIPSNFYLLRWVYTVYFTVSKK